MYFHESESKDLWGKMQALESRIGELEHTIAGSLAQQADALPHTTLTDS